MATINFGLKKQVSQEELQSIVDTAVKTRDRSDTGTLKRVLNEEQAVEEYLDKQKITDRGDKPNEELFLDAYNAMEKEEKKLYEIWQLELSEDTINAQDGGTEKILETLKRNPDVEFAELNQTYRLSWTPNEPQFSSLYGLKKVECEKAWNISKGKGVIVAVVDSGINAKHVDVSRNLARKNSNRDIIGYNFVDNNNDLSDTFGHGTHVAGIIAAVGNNSQGVIGVAPEAKIMPVKAFSGRTSNSNILANAIKFAVDHGAQVINNSWAYDERIPSDTTLLQAINYALQKGVVCVFAAGNKNENVRNYWIALHPELIVVASTDQNDGKAPGSNWGNEITVAAPGFEILSLQIGANNGVVTQSGTSMAAAHVSGAIALYLAKHGKTPVGSIKNHLKSKADYIATSVPLGSGRLNCFNLIR
ncbi:S8 family peptidase [Haliscomenobacter hydrossis]|uniref:Thermitase n=1 Tax=Haliscomenobacter hydrossis (strain ATCC 27775 / DSM 1100 / LMG 10767 / O) TaxID=760192 RepID=F4L0Y2_HALH1|nr:S8 family serine peptidase [Haliscomenobacter hydrossis]AEE50586.1 Thermitase [Haliscomenobacter hydrossis DSM 1100]